MCTVGEVSIFLAWALNPRKITYCGKQRKNNLAWKTLQTPPPPGTKYEISKYSLKMIIMPC